MAEADGQNTAQSEMLAANEMKGWNIITLPRFMSLANIEHAYGPHDFKVICGRRKCIRVHIATLSTSLPYFAALHNFREIKDRKVELWCPWGNGDIKDAFYSDFLENFLECWYLMPIIRKDILGKMLYRHLGVFTEISVYFGLSSKDLEVDFDFPLTPLRGLKTVNQLAWHKKDMLANTVLSKIAGDLFYGKDLKSCYKALNVLNFDLFEHVLSCKELKVPNESLVLDCIYSYIAANLKTEVQLDTKWVPDNRRIENLFSLHEGKVTVKMYKKIQSLRKKLGEPCLLKDKCVKKSLRWPKALGMVACEESDVGPERINWLVYFPINSILGREGKKSGGKNLMYQKIAKMPPLYNHRFDACTGSGDFAFCAISRIDWDAEPLLTHVQLWWINSDLPYWVEERELDLPFVPYKPTLTFLNDKLYYIGGMECDRKRTYNVDWKGKTASKRVFCFQLEYALDNGVKRLISSGGFWNELKPMTFGRGGHSVIPIGDELLISGGSSNKMIATRTAEV